MNETAPSGLAAKAELTPPPNATLAIHGGERVRKTPMPARLALGDNERQMILSVLDYYRERNVDPGYEGHFEKMYCRAFAEMMGGGYADAVATGTSSLYIAVAALNLPKGSEVLVSPITDPGSMAAIVLNGFKPRLMDTKPGSYNVGPEQFAERIEPNVTAAMIVHAAGQAAEIDKIVEIAHARGIKVIEDCAQSHGALLRAKRVGTFGDIAAFSTMYRKAHMTGAFRRRGVYEGSRAAPSRGRACRPRQAALARRIQRSRPVDLSVPGAQSQHRRNFLRDRPRLACPAAQHHHRPARVRVGLRRPAGRRVERMQSLSVFTDRLAVLLSRDARLRRGHLQQDRVRRGGAGRRHRSQPTLPFRRLGLALHSCPIWPTISTFRMRTIFVIARLTSISTSDTVSARREMPSRRLSRSKSILLAIDDFRPNRATNIQTR